MRIISFLLMPLGGLYGMAMWLRNCLFDRGFKKSRCFEEISTINVGNLSVGGTGKTPMVEYLIRHLKDRYRLAALSRGYGRKTKGFILADEHASAETIGDEPYQFYHKFSAEASVAVGERRAEAIPKLLARRPETELVILDDAYQHRYVRPDANILLTDYGRLFTKDYVLPAGRLRELRFGARRADAVVVTKCPPELSEQEQAQIETAVRRYVAPVVPVGFGTIRYAVPRAAFDPSLHISDFSQVVLVSGLASARKLKEYVSEKFVLHSHLEYKDHHAYSEKDCCRIREVWEQAGAGQTAVLTTEKDLVKFLQKPYNKLMKELPLFSLPIEFQFLSGEQAFLEMINQKIQKK
ncbi:MAG: tetraacyldisaccharide 4'-kinase [Cytophagales bacterium]|nr:tetraacyldisaccharide 4'-kinase [Cytophagales bacterium]